MKVFDHITSEVIPDVTPKKQAKLIKPVETIEIVQPRPKFATVIEDMPPPVLSAATLAEMEAGRAALQAIAAEKERLRVIVAQMGERE